MCMALLQRKTDVAPPPPPLGYDFRWCLSPLPCYYIVPEKDLVFFAV